MTSHRGRARRLGDDINTDYIIASTRKKETLDEKILKQYLLEAVDPGFAASVRAGDVLVAGANFGCGSAMEVAATVVLAAGIQIVLAKSFARSFYRNAINNGLLPIECDTSDILEGDTISVESDTSGTTVVDERTGRRELRPPLGGIAGEILAAGGLVPYLKRERRFVSTT
ncbi:MAG TPA: 3-isopropylmalate dehydratase [Gemmatimonadaceae bacterium]|jgi:3-isopropylmalate/(R)-2-methylmalate dehydratase small subunit|nr:3-isopropylmalate dehydratase [Gemmatimonadaceae bacterium]